MRLLTYRVVNCIISDIYPVTLSDITSLFDAPHHFEIFYNQMCGALEHLHRQNHVFVDLKPSNICIDTNRKFILIDIGSEKKIRRTFTLLTIF
jgi:serine/threonine protein kinase